MEKALKCGKVAKGKIFPKGDVTPMTMNGEVFEIDVWATADLWASGTLYAAVSTGYGPPMSRRVNPRTVNFVAESK